MLLDQIPGLQRAKARAIAREETLRRRAFMPGALRLCGLEVHPLTPRHFLLLDEARSPFIGHPGPPLAEHVAQFLWLVSPECLLPTRQVPLRAVRLACRAFVSRFGRKNYFRSRRAIEAYVEDAFFDAPAGAASTDAPIASTAAYLVHRYARAYHWPAQVLDERGQPIHGAGILDMPFAQLFQLHRLILLDTDPHYCPHNRLSDGVERACVRRFTRRQKARAARRQKARAARRKEAR